MSVDPLSRYGLSAMTGHAMLRTLDAIEARRAKLPSSDVIGAAMGQLGRSPDERGVSEDGRARRSSTACAARRETASTRS